MDEVLRAFHCLWDSFPEQARLIGRDHRVLAVNPAAEAKGMKTGERCCDRLPLAGHAGCLAIRALDTHTAQWDINPSGTRIRFWIPVEGADAYVHYSVPVMEHKT